MAGAPPASATSAGRAADSPPASRTSGRSTPPSSTSATPRPTEHEVTLWLWSPEAQPMDLRFYHDGTGPGHLPGAARRPQHHLRGLRARLRHPLRHRPYPELLFMGNATTPSAETLAEQVEAVRVLLPAGRPAGAAHQVQRLAPASTPEATTAPHLAKAKIEDHASLFHLLQGQGEQHPFST
ncbi:hypothetical protein LV779_16290, partial [Streptomyces thinghirensis]|nr:hypothetical protein [Streptomyces thinghirensis]